MASRPAPALVRLRGPARLRPLSGRVATVAGVLACALALAYLGARQTSVFAVHEVAVAGAPPGVRAEVRAAAAPLVGTSLVALDGDALVERLEALPEVRAAAYDRAFPHTLAIAVEPERPLAALRRGKAWWVVSERGRVIRRAGARPRLPRIRASGDPLAPGAVVADPRVLEPLAALALLPRRFPLAVRSARVEEGRLTIALAGATELRLGEGVAVGLKLTVAERVLAALTPAEREALAYLDVSLPERPVAADKVQVEG